MRNICVDCPECAVTVVSGEPHQAASVLVAIESADEKMCLPLDHNQAVHFSAALMEASLYHCSEDLRGKFRNLARDLLRATSTPLKYKP